MAALPPTPDLVTIRTPGGAHFSVARQYAPQFQGLTTELEQGGYTIDPSHSGGYNRRYIAGTETPSEHAYGRAIDVNWDQNPHGSANGSIPSDVARALAAKYGLTWGGDWQGNSADPMHFQVAGAPGGGVNMGGTSSGNLGVADANLPTPPVPPAQVSPTVAPGTNPPSMQAQPAANPAMMAMAAQALSNSAGGGDQLSSLFTQPAQALQNYYKSFFDPSNAPNV